MFPVNEEIKSIHQLVSNLDYAIRLSGASSTLVVSDYPREGKSTFLIHGIPLYCEIYSRNVLVFDLQGGGVLEDAFGLGEGDHQFIRKTKHRGLDYIKKDDLLFLNSLEGAEKLSALTHYYNEVASSYHNVFINMKISKRREDNYIPSLPLDSAILIRSKHSIEKKDKEMTQELTERSIPVIGIIYNEGI